MAGIPATKLANIRKTKERFTQVTPQGWAALANLVENPSARLYVFIADHCGHDNALVCTYELLAEELDLSERTIRRAVHHLIATNHLHVAKVGTANAYIMNDAEIWKTSQEHKRFCAFNTRTLVSKKANPDLKKRMTHMFADRAKVEAEAA